MAREKAESASVPAVHSAVALGYVQQNRLQSGQKLVFGFPGPVYVINPGRERELRIEFAGTNYHLTAHSNGEAECLRAEWSQLPEPELTRLLESDTKLDGIVQRIEKHLEKYH